MVEKKENETEKLIRVCDQINQEIVSINNEVLALREMLILLLSSPDEEVMKYIKINLTKIIKKEKIKISPSAKKTIGFK